MNKKYKLQVVYLNIFKRQLKKVLKQGKDLAKLKFVVNQLANQEKLDSRFKNHRLRDNKYYKNCYECHIEPDWLLVYQINDQELILYLINTGSHSDLFNK